MKAIQITVDEDLLREIDATAEAKLDGRSAIFRRAAASYLRSQRNLSISAAYIQAYRDSPPLGEELEGWSEQGEWPDK